MRNADFSWWQKHRTLIISLSAIVVFITTYLLILPALTLEKETAEQQGGINIETEAPENTTDASDTSISGQKSEKARDTMTETVQAAEKQSEQDQTVEKRVEASKVEQKETGFKDGKISYEGKDYSIQVSYTKEAKIPEGVKLKAKEITKNSKEYKEYCEETAKELNTEIKYIVFARFFDIEILDGKKEIEPSSPVQVEIAYKEAVDVDTTDDLRVVHFVEEGSKVEPEIIEKVKLNKKKKEISYKQDSFSVTGTVVQTPEASHQYALIIHHTDGNYYVVENDGSLTRISTTDITFNDDHSVQSVKMVNPICWTYESIGYSNFTIYHNTDARAYDVPGTSLPTAYTRRYLSADVPSGYADLDDDINPWNLNRRDYCPNDGRYVNIGYNQDHTLNHYDHVLGVSESSDGTLHVVGQADHAAEIYFAETQSVSSVSAQNHTVNHIDISVEGSSGIKVPLAYGTYRLAEVSDEDLANIDNIDDINSHIIGYRDNNLVVSHVNNVTLEVERMVPINQNDIKKADITAYVERDGKKVYLDDVYSVTGYSGNAETSSDTPQVRLEGSFKVADLNPVSGNEDQANTGVYYENGQRIGIIRDVRLQRPIHYTVAVNKPVTFTMTYTDPATNKTYVVLKEDGTPFRVTIDVSLSSSFTYFDEDNTCPGIRLWTYGEDRWRHGEIRSNNNAGMGNLDVGPGFDFRLGAPMNEADHDIVAVEVTKYIQGDFGTEIRTLSLQEATSCGINVYQNNSTTPLHNKTMSIGKDGIGLMNDYDVVAGNYQNPAYAQISEDPDSVPDVVIDSQGNTWTYAYSYVETEFAWRNDGQTHPSRYRSQIYTKDDSQYLSESEVIGEYSVENGIPYDYQGEHYDGVHEYNRFEEFYVYNIYKQVETVNVPIDKTWYDEEGNLINDDDPNSPYDWTATFVLEEREVHESGPVTDRANTTTWRPVEGVESITISKDDSETARSYKSLPKYRYYYDAQGHESKYRILYSVSETAYTLKKSNVVISEWDNVNGLTTGDNYWAPQFPHDAGDADDTSGIGAGDPRFYHIIVTNSRSDEIVEEEIDLTLSKRWPEGVLDGIDNPFASFQLKRYKMTEYYEQDGEDEEGKPIWVYRDGDIEPAEDLIFTNEKHIYTLNNGNEWSLVIPRLTKTSGFARDGQKTVYNYSYYFEEVTSNPSGFYAVIKTSGDTPIVIDESHRIDVAGTAVVAENKPSPETLIYKVDEKNINQENIEQYLLPGASFKVVKYNSFEPAEIDTTWGNNGEKAVNRQDGDPDGKFVVDGLIPGLYELQELSYPAGYIKPAEDLRFKVVLDGQDKLIIESLSEGATVRIINDYKNTGKNVIIYGNTPGVALPHTGGRGTALLYVLGSMMILGAGVLLIRRFKKVAF